MKYMKIKFSLAALTLVLSGSLMSVAAPEPPAKTPQQLEEEIVALRQTLNEQEKELQYSREMTSGVGDNAVMAPFGRFLLIKYDTQCLALRITEHVDFRIVQNAEQYTSKYEWFLQTDGSMDFSKANVRKGSGELSEIKDGKYQAAYIRVGSFPALEWSLSDWIYFSEGATPVGGHPPGSKEALREKNMRMARTEWVRIGDVKPQSETLTWLSKVQDKQ